MLLRAMSFVPGLSAIANASASVIGVVTIGLVTMKYIFRNYPKFPTSKFATYQVASLKGCRIKSKENDQFTVQFQIFYPCVSSSDHNSNELPSPNNEYMRHTAVEGLSRTFGNRRLLSFVLKSVLKDKLATHLLDGLTESVSPLKRPTLNDKGEKTLEETWPTVIFSHGLFGSMELYSTICREIASHGFVVVAPEHEDSSASYAEKATSHEFSGDGIRKSDQVEVIFGNGAARIDLSEGYDEYFAKYVIPYKTPEDVVYSEKESVINFRRPFLQKRFQELRYLIIGLIQLASDPQTAENNPNYDHAITEDFMSFEKKKLREVLLTTNLTDPDKKSVILAGHSFGGSTVLSMVHQLNDDITTMIKGVNIKSLLLLDTWVSPVPDEILSRKLNIPTMSIFCETFVTWKPRKVPHELNGVEKLLEGNKGSIKDENNEMFQCVAIRGTEHQFYADVPYWFPKCFARYGGVSGKTDVTISRSCLEKLIVKFLLKNQAPSEIDLTNEEKNYVYKVNEAMLNPPKL